MRICKIVDFAVPADLRIKVKEYEKEDKYLNLARDMKKLWNKQVTIILIDRFGLVSLFNDISTFVGYLMPKLSS